MEALILRRAGAGWKGSPHPTTAAYFCSRINPQKQYVMTKEELEDMLHVMGLDYEAETDQIYVFYVRPDGCVDNLSISVRRGRKMSDNAIVEMMRREYPATRQGEVMAVERPHGFVNIKAQEQSERPKEEWLDTTDVCNMLKVSDRTLRSWTRQGYLKAYYTKRRVYYLRTEIDTLIKKNAIGEDGRLDKTVLIKT